MQNSNFEVTIIFQSVNYPFIAHIVHDFAICLLLVLETGPELLNVAIFAILGIYTTTALPVGNHLKATTIVLLARVNVWCVLRLLKIKNKNAIEKV